MQTNIATTNGHSTEPMPMEKHIPLYSFDMSILQSPVAQRAYRQGLLRAKGEALKTAQRLVYIGRPLLFAILFVSFVHLWVQVAHITPRNIAALVLPAFVYYISAALLIVSIDATALYIISCRSTGLYSGIHQRQRAVWFFYVLTALLNGMFVLSYTPNMPAFTVTLLPTLNFIIALLLALLIPVSIVAVETAHQIAERTRLALLVEVATLQGLNTEGSERKTPRQAQDAGDISKGIANPGDAILNLLATNARKMTYAEIASTLSRYPQGTISHHLSKLYRAGDIRREGTARSYRYFL